MGIFIPSYWLNYGPTNFLWISDVTLILTFFAVLFENKIFASLAAVGGLVLELIWTISFFLNLLFNIDFFGLTNYMFDNSLPFWLRLLSLFHVFLPPLLIWLVFRLGYLKKAVIIQILLTWIIVFISWKFTNPSKNINWVFSYMKLDMTPLLYLIMESLAIGLTLLITHVFLMKIPKRYQS